MECLALSCLSHASPRGAYGFLYSTNIVRVNHGFRINSKKIINPFRTQPLQKLTPIVTPPPPVTTDLNSDEDGDDRKDCEDGEVSDDGSDNGEAEGEVAEVLPTYDYDMYVPEGLENKKTRQLFGSNIRICEEAGGKVVVKEVKFIKSSSEEAECPKDGFPEFAMIGRSNVGKSSLINLLVGRKRMALTSKRPGKTQLLNHFLVNKSWFLVDLPGYGYAEAPNSVCKNWDKFTKEYFKTRKALAMVVMLVDSTVPPKAIDIEYAMWLGENNIPFTIAFTKCEKRRKGRKPVENLFNFLNKLKEKYPKPVPWILTSCVTTQGRDDLLLHLSEHRRRWHKLKREVV